jgi:PPOX class probable F420-dependent enzyme
VLGLDRARELGGRESGLAVVVTVRSDGSPQVSVVNAGVLDHPVTGEPIVGFVARGRAKKLSNLRRRPRVTVVFRSGWDWVAVEGDAELAGPGDLLAGFDPSDVPRLLRVVLRRRRGRLRRRLGRAGRGHGGRAHTAVLVRPSRIYSNPGE